MPVKEVKIDRSFITNLVEDTGDQAFVRTIVSLASSLDLDVVAEGVEDQDAWTMTGELGCTHIQGYFLSRPLPAAAFRDWAAAALESHTGGTDKVTPFERPARRVASA